MELRATTENSQQLNFHTGPGSLCCSHIRLYAGAFYFGGFMDLKKMLHDIVEAVGECNHVWDRIGHADQCIHCGLTFNIEQEWLKRIAATPSPTDLNELFRLAKKLNYHLEFDVDGNGQTKLSVHRDNLLSIRPVAQSLEGLQLAEALLHALHKSLPEKE